MDTAIEKGDFATDAGGIPKPLFGLEQQLQQVYLRLKGRRGCFYYDPFFGSRLHTLPEHPTRGCALALAGVLFAKNYLCYNQLIEREQAI